MRSDTDAIRELLQIEESQPNQILYDPYYPEYWELRWMLGYYPHREFGPAIEKWDQTKEWYFLGTLHREGGPAIIVPSQQLIGWHQHGKLHREDGPAMESYGSKFWFCRGLRHRKDGPAVEKRNGSCEYWIQGKRFDSRKDFLKALRKH
jgi:hypothetical protein